MCGLTRLAVSAGLVSVVAGCGVDPAKVPSHEVYAKHGEVVKAKGKTSFAVVGTTRSVAYGVRGEPKVPSEVITDVRSQIAVRGLDFVVLTGGFVRRSTTDEWKAFDERWKHLLEGETPSDNKARKKVLPLPGSGELLGDRRLKGYGAAFPDAGAAIGYNRVASWGHTDIDLGDTTWRLLFLDSNKAALGSRWQEQIFWLPKVIGDDSYDKMVVFMSDPRITLAQGAKMNRGGAPSELIDIIEEEAGVMKMMAIVSSGPGTNELFHPSGIFGEAYVVAGNSGISMPTLMKAGAADAAGYKDLGLEPFYDTAMMGEFNRWSEDLEFPESVVDKAKARGEWETYIGRYDGDSFPIQGWWVVTLEGEDIELTFPHAPPRRHLLRSVRLAVQARKGLAAQAGDEVMKVWFTLGALLLCGCGPDQPTDTDDGDSETRDEGCPDVNIWVDGPEAPQVGDEWTVVMKCEDAVMVGPMILRFDPPEIATVTENEVTFVQAGTASMRVQVGSYVERMDVVVTE